MIISKKIRIRMEESLFDVVEKMAEKNNISAPEFVGNIVAGFISGNRYMDLQEIPKGLPQYIENVVDIQKRIFKLNTDLLMWAGTERFSAQWIRSGLNGWSWKKISIYAIWKDVDEWEMAGPRTVMLEDKKTTISIPYPVYKVMATDKREKVEKTNEPTEFTVIPILLPNGLIQMFLE